jgi:hypothetical protein
MERDNFMNADHFSTIVTQLCPTSTELNEQGINDNLFIDKILNSYNLRRASNFPTKDPLLDLCTNFDVSSFEAGIVYLKHPIKGSNKNELIVGYVESDPLVVSLITCNVWVSDHESFGHKMCECAPNGDVFLDALAIVFRHSTLRLKKGINASSETASLAECIKIVKNKKYRLFWSMLLGVDESTHVEKFYRKISNIWRKWT